LNNTPTSQYRVDKPSTYPKLLFLEIIETKPFNIEILLKRIASKLIYLNNLTKGHKK